MAARKGKNLLEQALRVAQASSRSHPARLTGLLSLATRAFGLSSAAIYLPDPFQDALTQRFAPLLPLSSRCCLIPYGHGCAGRAALGLCQETTPQHELHADEPCAPGQTVVSTPLLEGRNLVAVLSFAAGETGVAAAAAAECQELFPIFQMLIAGHVAAERAEQTRRNVTFLATLGTILNGSQPPDQMLQQVLKLCTGSGLARCAMARLRENEKGKARLYKSCRSESRETLPALQGIEPRLSAKVAASDVTCRQQPESIHDCHALSTPLGRSGTPLGTLTFFGGPDLFEPEQVELVETVGRLVSCALTEAMSSQRILSFAKDNENKLKELSLLYRMSNTMLSTIKLNKLIHLTLTALTSGPEPFFDRAMLFLVNERSGVLLGMLGVTRETAPPLSIPEGGSDDILSSRWDISEAEMAAQRESEFCRQVLGKRLELDGSLNIASQAVLEKRLIYIPDEIDATGFGLHGGKRPGLAASPLIAHGQAVGAVLVDNAITRSTITQEDLRFLQLFTNQAGMAIENSMLYNKIEDANRQLSEAQENLLQKERLAAIGEMAAGIAHELKGPLVSIGGFAGRLTRKLPQDTHEWGHADLIVREVLRLEAILSEILLFSKKTTICYTRCNIADIVKDSLDVVTPPLEEKQISVSTKFPRQKLLLLGDAQQLKQVFINIILNALDAMGNGGKLAIHVTGVELEGRDAVCVKIADTGGGIPLEALNSIFTPFYTTKESGTGLGLPIANRIITNHGGKIQVTNTPGQGVEFRVILPKHW
jgi:two-component system, NtrC family, sensor histidine kinase HydH